jgi:hypothetical protein
VVANESLIAAETDLEEARRAAATHGVDLAEAFTTYLDADVGVVIL